MRKTKKKRYNIINKKRIFVLICLIMLVIFEIVAFKNSRANKILEITASIIDDDEKIETEQINLEATSLGASGYSLILPEYINNKRVDSYIIKEKDIHAQDIPKDDESVIEENIAEESNINQEIIENEMFSEEVENNIQMEENVQVENTIQEDNSSIEKLENEVVKNQTSETTTIKIPGDTIYLTDEEVKNKQIELNVLYSTSQSNGQLIYEQKIQTDVDDNEDGVIDSSIQIEGFMPLNSVVQVTVVGMEKIEETIVNELSDKISFKKAYDIKIIYNEQEYEPTDFDTNVKVTISGIDSINKEKQKYKVVHIDDSNTVQEVKGVKTTDDAISFPADSFSTYAVLLEDGLADISVYSADLEGASIWNGSIAAGFRFGDGTEQSPYLITNAAEFAYIAQQVNNGNSYDGVYFELITDINLNGREWTPIGSYTNSFKGIFDGAGHTVAHAIISLPSEIPTSVTSYGIFGSIGDGTNKTTIKNLQLDDINIEINASGSTANDANAKGYNIGIVAGTMYNNAEIKNVIVNNSNITDNYTMTIRTNSTQIFAGGIVGLAVNSRYSTADPGTNGRYAIENCYSNTNIDLDISLYEIPILGTQYYVAGQYGVGGIIGGIRNQAVWPTNCLYKGSLNASNAFTGPIFGYLRGNTTISNNTNNFNTFWQGNDTGNLTMSSYYTSYSTNNRAFTANEVSGTSSSRIATNGGTWNFNIGYVQGVNKGLYTNNSANMLANFNNYIINNLSNGYMTWYYEANSEAFYFTPELSGYVEKNVPQYTIIVNDKAATGNYTYDWYIDGALDPNIIGDNMTMESTWTDEHIVEVLISNGRSYAMVSFDVPKLEIHVSFEMNNQTNTLTASLEGTGTVDPNFNINDYTYQWYKLDIIGDEEIVDGATTTTITNLENGMDYKIVATNGKYSYMSTEGIYASKDRTVIYCSYNNGNDANDGFTPQTPVRTLATAYGKFASGTTRNQNVIVLMGQYTDTGFLNSANSTTYNKNVTITGRYQGVKYNAVLSFEGNNTYRYLNGNTTFMHLAFDGSSWLRS